MEQTAALRRIISDIAAAAAEDEAGRLASLMAQAAEIVDEIEETVKALADAVTGESGRVEFARRYEDAARMEWLDCDSVRVRRLHLECGYSGSISGRNLAPFATVYLGNAEFRAESVREAIDLACRKDREALL